jgi:lipopolysaccharide/colanic/teichoic acid biosynthesis glycosyltransferase/dTDP-glucose pyrophosphorylase
MDADVFSDIRAVVAVGGVKSRTIDPVNVSKALIPIINKPAFVHTLETLKEIGVPEAFLIFNEEGAEASLFSERLSGFAIQTLVEKNPRGTAGCLKPIEDRLLGHTIILAAGLVVLSADDLKQMIAHHRKAEADLTVGLVKLAEKEPLSERVVINDNNEVEDVIQVHASMERRSHMKTSGVYVFESCVLEHIHPDKFMDIKEQLLPKLRRSGMRISSWVHTRNGHGIRSVGDYLRANFELLRDCDLASAYLDGYREIDKQVWVGKNVHIDPSVTLVRPIVIGDDVRINRNVTIVGPSIIGQRCQVDKDSFIRESIFLPDSSLPSSQEVDRCLISGKIIGLDDGYCRESIILDGEPFLDGVGAALGAITVRKVIKMKGGIWKGVNKGLYPSLKRLFDVAASTTAILLTLPFWAVIACLIKLNSRGPIFFIQTRCGKDGKPFEMIKFRTMIQDAEQMKKNLQHLNESDGPMFKIYGDPRETRVGRFLRYTKLDELPQFLNVLWGNMSMVGPRPLSMKEMRFNPHWRDVRLQVHQGMTGLWQIKSKDHHNFHEWIRYDLQYVDECNFLLDLKIVFLTFLKTLHLC